MDTVTVRDLHPCMQMVDGISGKLFAWHCQDSDHIWVYPDTATFMRSGDAIDRLSNVQINPVTRMPRWPDFVTAVLGYLRKTS
jgi:hypothetical protein